MTKEKEVKGPRISRDEVLIRTARLFALRSTCWVGNGAVIAKGGRIISTGYNGSPSGQPHCVDEGCLLDGQGHCQRAVHAEANAIAMAAMHGISTQASTIYCTTAPCPSCSKLLINSGIIRVVYDELYSDSSGIDLLKDCNIQVKKLSE